MNEKHIESLYDADKVGKWEKKKTMEHPSGVWGRKPMLKYLEEEIIEKGDTVVDLGSGSGHPSSEVAQTVGKEGHVIGVELNKNQLGLNENQTPVSKQYEDIENLNFVNGDIKNIPLDSESANKIVSFMVLHNLKSGDVKNAFIETQRILKDGGKAVFLTMHPDVFESDWELDFMKYNPEDLKKYKEAEDKEDVLLKGIVENIGGEKKEVGMYHHTREKMDEATEEAGLKIIEEQDLYIDKETAEEKYGEGSVKKAPNTPSFWIIT